MKYILCIVFTILIFSFDSYAQNDWHTYPIRSIAELVKQHSGEESSQGDMVISAKPFPSKTSVTYTGKKRPISHYTKSFIKIWVQTRNVPAENADMLVEEYLFKEKDVEYWIPVLKKLTPYLEKELKEGDEIVVYYFYLGGFNPKKLHEKDTAEDKPKTAGENKIRWIFAVEEFEKAKPQPNSFITKPLSDVIDRKLEKVDEKADLIFDPRQVKSNSQVIYTGKTRQIGKKRVELFKLWIKNTNAPESLFDIFQTEVLFIQGDNKYWIPVWSKVLTGMKKQFKANEEMTIHTILIGATKEKDSFAWMFICGNYMKK